MKKLIAFTVMVILFLTTNFPVFGQEIGPFKLMEEEKSFGMFYEMSNSIFLLEDSDVEGLSTVLRKIGVNAEYSIKNNIIVKLAIGSYDLLTIPISDNHLNFFGTIGIKKILDKEWQNFNLIPFAQATYYAKARELEDDETFSLKNQYKVSLGILGQRVFDVFGGSIKFYAGPFVYLAQNIMEVTWEFLGRQGIENTRFREKGNIGVLLGANIPIGNGFMVNLEIQQKSGEFLSMSISQVF